MGICEGRVAIVTGAGRGVGRAYALKLAQEGAKVVVNDLGGSAAGAGADLTPAQEVVEEIRAAGGEAVVNGADVSDWEQARQMVQQAVDSFGGLDILVNNAGILRDRMMVNMTEEDWDLVIKVHLKGTFAPSHHAANYWRLESKAGRQRDARIINTSSGSGLFGNIGQANYGAAKAGVASFSIITARELGRIGVTVNAIAPRAQTRMTEGLREVSGEMLERRDPEWIAALVAYLSSPEAADITGRVFAEVWGYGYTVGDGWKHGPRATASRGAGEVGESLRHALAAAGYNGGIERDTFLNP
ncbi:SDR family NAD(P)-dependent oxidoreductase [Sandaracinobacter sp. RS1-74]|uniref:SDR family oxidoreductase n=1 Tax=Sandaracinobacteroides sayramensis TaxID=2913411 RepID=UPI001EDAB327|nr:SDR family oxidoreductase [Sandaracinobacteroides sayramensis]MCG2840911.1 SDR family NAD(P)-dependent oxidoreductase [Sandaracinobacteroides sayramensis]